SMDNLPLADLRVVSPGYFTAMGIGILAGRPFTQSDRDRSVIIVSKSLANQLWPGKNPIGQRCRAAGSGEALREVIGVASDVRTARLDKAAPLMTYLPSVPFPGLESAIVVRTAMDPLAIAAAVRAVIHHLDPQVPITALQPMQEVVTESLAARRFQMVLVA